MDHNGLIWIHVTFHVIKLIQFFGRSKIGCQNENHRLGCYKRPGALCVQMNFTRTFEANTKCNNNKYVWSQFYQILVVLKYHRCLWNNIFDTGIFRCINTHIKGVYLALFWIFMLLEMSVLKILSHRHFRTTKIW